MKYIIYSEPFDIEANSIEEARVLFMVEMKTLGPIIAKILPTDEDGFIIEQPKAHAPL